MGRAYTYAVRAIDPENVHLRALKSRMQRTESGEAPAVRTVQASKPQKRRGSSAAVIVGALIVIAILIAVFVLMK